VQSPFVPDTIHEYVPDLLLEADEQGGGKEGLKCVDEEVRWWWLRKWRTTQRSLDRHQWAKLNVR